MGFINAKYFNARYKLPVHIAEILLVLVVIILTVVRLAMGNTQRVHIMGIAFVSSLAVEQQRYPPDMGTNSGFHHVGH